MSTRKPKVGDFVLWENAIWEVKKVVQKTVIVENLESILSGLKPEIETFFSDSMELTNIKTWELD